MTSFEPEQRNRPKGLTAELQHVRKVYAFWGHHPAIYAASDYLTFLGRPALVRGRAVQALDLKNDATVLELGCGTGRNLPFLKDSVGEKGKIVGFDYSLDMLSAAGGLVRKNGWKNVTLIQGDAAVLDMDEPVFDGVLSVLAVSAIPNWQEALLRCHEVLRPGGILSVCDACLFHGPLKVLNPLIRLFYRKYAAWDPTRDIPGQMNRIFGNISVERFNLGTFFVAKSVKKKNSSP